MSVTRSVDLVSRLFPRLGDRVAALYDRDDVFRELCGEYSICLDAVDRAEASGLPHLRAEYSALQLRLETELLQQLEEFERRPDEGAG
jgi:hypothetical protein